MASSPRYFHLSQSPFIFMKPHSVKRARSKQSKEAHEARRIARRQEEARAWVCRAQGGDFSLPPKDANGIKYIKENHPNLWTYVMKAAAGSEYLQPAETNQARDIPASQSRHVDSFVVTIPINNQIDLHVRPVFELIEGASRCSQSLKDAYRGSNTPENYGHSIHTPSLMVQESLSWFVAGYSAGDGQEPGTLSYRDNEYTTQATTISRKDSRKPSVDSPKTLTHGPLLCGPASSRKARLQEQLKHCGNSSMHVTREADNVGKRSHSKQDSYALLWNDIREFNLAG